MNESPFAVNPFSREIRVLLIENDLAEVRRFKEVLSEAGEKLFPVTWADRMAEGLSRISGDSVDLIALGLSLPDSSGADLFARVHAQASHLPIVLLVSAAQETEAQQAVLAGAQDYLIRGKWESSVLPRVLRYAVERKAVERMKDEFVSSVSHELRTPLAIVKEGVSLVLDGVSGPLTADQDKILKVAQDNIDRLARIIENLLDVSELDRGRMKLKIQPIDIFDLIRKKAEQLAPKIREKGIEFSVQIPSEKKMMEADPIRVEQILTSLLGNALKFTRKGSIVLSVTEEPDRLICQISDTGIGIAREDLPKIFRRFQQFGRKDGPGEQGTGLGLWLSQQFIELHGGSVWVESEQGRGTRVFFSLPKPVVPAVEPA